MAKVPLTPKSMEREMVASPASIAVKRSVSMLVTYSVLPSGVSASERGFGGTGMRSVMRPCGERTRTWLPAMSVVNILSAVAAMPYSPSLASAISTVRAWPDSTSTMVSAFVPELVA